MSIAETAVRERIYLHLMDGCFIHFNFFARLNRLRSRSMPSLFATLLLLLWKTKQNDIYNERYYVYQKNNSGNDSSYLKSYFNLKDKIR